MQALTSLLAVFSPVCDFTEYAVSYTNSSLPRQVEYETMLREIVPVDHSEELFLQWYERGLSECKDYLATRPFDGNVRTSPIFNMAKTDSAGATTCRGNRMLHEVTGLVVWPFGPIRECQTYSRCWFGLLTCGNFDNEKFSSLFGSDGSRVSATFQGWSMGALHVDMSVSGREVVAPRVRHTTFPTPKHLKKASVGPSTSVIVADYVLTVDGADYTIDLGLMGLYPRTLYRYNPDHNRMRRQLFLNSKTEAQDKKRTSKTSKSRLSVPKPPKKTSIGPRPADKVTNKIQSKALEKGKSKLKFGNVKDITNSKSLELLKSVFLGGCERRPGDRTFCVPACQTEAQIIGSPFKLKVSPKPSSLLRNCSNGAASQSNLLPYCTGGNHVGRYLRLPWGLIKHCNSAKYSALMAEERKQQQGKRQWPHKYEAIENQYFRHAQTVDSTRALDELRANLAHDKDSFVYHTELLRYLENQNVCLLVDIGKSREIPDGRADIYAPYFCKYHVYDWEKAKKCYHEERGVTLFHGDSMNRALFGRFCAQW